MALAVFRAYTAPEHQAEDDRRYHEMKKLVEQNSGYVGHKNFTAEDGETVLIVEFDDLDSLRKWGEHPDHKIAQRAGRDYIYTSYDVAVCEVVDRHIKSDVSQADLPSIDSA